jgi:hypothetical protein
MRTLIALALYIQFHDAFGVSPDERREALRIVNLLLAAASVEPAWAVCSGEGKGVPDPRCAKPPEPGDIVLRLLRAPPLPASNIGDVFGYAVLDRSTGRGTLATVFPDRIRALAAAAGRGSGDLLGRAMAHEIGHLLLATTTHAKEGLMREHWLTSQVKRGFGRDWSFTHAEVAQIRGGLAPVPAVQRAERGASVAPLPITR